MSFKDQLSLYFMLYIFFGIFLIVVFTQLISVFIMRFSVTKYLKDNGYDNIKIIKINYWNASTHRHELDQNIGLSCRSADRLTG